MKTFNIYKKRDGQSYKLVGDIFASTFEEAKKEFALNMTKDNWEKSNNIVWLTPEDENFKVGETGWYDLNSIDNRTELPELFYAEKDIKEGFDRWNEDVYTWELRDNLDYKEIYDLEDFEAYKDDYSFFMAYDSERFYLYNGKFDDIAEMEGIGYYSDKDDKFMGCPIEEMETINVFLK